MNMQNLRGPLNELLKMDKPWLWTHKCQESIEKIKKTPECQETFEKIKKTPECQETFEKIKKTPECQETFENIKKTLTSDLSLIHYDPTLDIIVASDASSYGIGACILHKLPNGSRKAVAHASRSLLPAEKQYSQIEKEALGIIFAVTKFLKYLHGRRFILQTDHKPLITIFGSKKGLPVYTANRLLRWGTILLNYNFKIEFLTSKNICHADSLSQRIPKNTEVFEVSIIATLRTNLRNQKQCSQEKSSLYIRQTHSRVSKVQENHLAPIRNISILAIKFFSRPTKTTLHSGKWAPSNKGLANWSILSRDQKSPTNAIWTSSGNAVWMNLRNPYKILAKSRSTQYSIISISTRHKSLRKYDAREEKENLRNHLT